MLTAAAECGVCVVSFF